MTSIKKKITYKNSIFELFRLLRPEQWVKNVFVFTGLLFGKDYISLLLIFQVCLTALAFCFISSSVYVFNDIFDYENDLNHEKKKSRPLPAGKISFQTGWALTIIIGVIGLLLGFYVSIKVGIILLTYIFINVLYTLRLKHVEVVDVFCISLGFILRILAGTIGVGIEPSNWLLLCGMMITLFLGFSKRFAEMNLIKIDKTEPRQVLKKYRKDFLTSMITITATGAIISYSLYTMSPQTIQIHQTQNLIYTVPFVIYGLFRYMFLLNRPDFGENPSKDLIQDPSIMFSILAWGGVSWYIIYY